ncbi:hypothetical protein BJV78DRAFT_1198272, partial [Lactifluus subvellereus]
MLSMLSTASTHRLCHAETAFEATAYGASLAPDALRAFEMNESDRGRHRHYPLQ